jgi:subtilisin family serine protease
LPPDDPSYGEQWGMLNIGMPQVWEHVTGSENVCVAVIDSGIDYNHPDLNANMAKDSRGNYGRLFDNGEQGDRPIDTQGHGTHVAGIIGAVGNNGIGVTGVNWKVKLLAVNVMPKGKALDTDVITAINYILAEKKAGLNIRVANMSFGGWEVPLPDNNPFKAAISSLSDAGIICVMAVGNDVQNINNPEGKYVGKLVYPACFRFTNTIAVGSIGRENIKSGFSNYGNSWADIAAPGEKIYSTTPNSRYGTMEGTSMSAAHVTGAVAILCAAFPNETASQIKGRILRGAKIMEDSKSYWGSGLLDVAGAYGIESKPENDEPMTSVKIAGKKNISMGDSSFYSHTKNPSSSNGRFEYVWKSSDELIAKISGKNSPSAEIIGVASGTSTITISVTQTLQNGTKITVNDSFEVTITKKPSSDSSGCNLGLSIVGLLLLLQILRNRQKK